MENPNVPFAIEETSGELFTTNALDRETVAIYSLTVIGSDKHPIQPLSSSVLVTVLIGDINDHWPQFMNSPYVAHVPNKMDSGERVYCHFILGNILSAGMSSFILFISCFSYRLSCLCSKSNRWRFRDECRTTLFAIWTNFRSVYYRSL